MSDFRDSMKVEIDYRDVLENQKKEHFRELLGFYLGSILHEDWKKDDEIAYLAASDEKKAKNWEVGEDGILRKFKPVNGEVDGKSYVDRSFGFESDNPAYRETERKVDIRALTFEKLPLVWQKENADAGKAAMDLTFEKVLNGDEIDIEELSAKVHEAWLSRPNNSWAIQYQSEESKPYAELSEPVKAKDRRHIELALELLEKVKNGSITYEELKEKVGPAMNKFNSQMKQIEEEQK